jgi:hypothetical protein
METINKWKNGKYIVLIYILGYLYVLYYYTIGFLYGRF